MDSTQLKSKRPDGRGHWPKGKPRHSGLKLRGWKSPQDFIARLMVFVRAERKYGQLARDLGIHTSTLWRWSQGIHLPDQPMLDRLVAWYREHKNPPKDTPTS